MAKGIHLGAGAVKKTKEIYVGAGIVKKAKEAYIGVGGAVKKVWPSMAYDDPEKLFDLSLTDWQFYHNVDGSSYTSKGFLYSQRPYMSRDFTWEGTSLWAATLNPIDLSGYDYIFYAACIKERWNGSFLLSFSKINTDKPPDKKEPTFDSRVIKDLGVGNDGYDAMFRVDISSLNGLYYIKAGHHLSGFIGDVTFYPRVCTLTNNPALDAYVQAGKV